ncbi:hypothetical protein EV363DRAFT_1420670 [Boletus edulis]|nr:hypothetical protein EV363DRAFT_1420670 [Boletus edulis]
MSEKLHEYLQGIQGVRACVPVIPRGVCHPIGVPLIGGPSQTGLVAGQASEGEMVRVAPMLGGTQRNFKCTKVAYSSKSHDMDSPGLIDSLNLTHANDDDDATTQHRQHNNAMTTITSLPPRVSTLALPRLHSSPPVSKQLSVACVLSSTHHHLHIHMLALPLLVTTNAATAMPVVHHMHALSHRPHLDMHVYTHGQEFARARKA